MGPSVERAALLRYGRNWDHIPKTGVDLQIAFQAEGKGAKATELTFGSRPVAPSMDAPPVCEQDRASNCSSDECAEDRPVHWTSSAPWRSESPAITPLQNRTKRRMQPGGTVLLLVAEIMGTGVLSLPHAALKIGQGPAFLALLGCAAAAAFSGHLLSNLHCSFFPSAVGYDVAAQETGGAVFGAFTGSMIGLNWTLLLPYYIIATVDAVKLIFPATSLSAAELSVIVAAMLCVPIQLRSLRLITYLCAPSSLAIIVAILLILLDFSREAPKNQAGAEPALSAAPATPGSFAAFFSHVSSFVFAYQGQSIFLEMMREMETPSRFPCAANSAYAFMCTVYLLTVFSACSLQGDAVAAFLPDGMGEGPSKSIVGVCIAFHTIVAYVVTGQPLYRKVLACACPGIVDSEDPAARWPWLLINLSFLGFSCFIASSIPFFGDIQEFIGSLCGAPIVFGWPAFFYLKAHYLKHHDLAALIRAQPISLIVCLTFICVFTPLFTILGTMSSANTIAESIRAHWNLTR